MGFYKEKGFLNDDVTIFKNVVVSDHPDYGEIKKWVGTVSKGLYVTETSIQFTETKEEQKTTGFFIIQEYLELRDGEEERIVKGNYPGEFDTIPDYARDVVKIVDVREVKNYKSGTEAEWLVYVK